MPLNLDWSANLETLFFTLAPALVALVVLGGIWISRYARRRRTSGAQVEVLVHKGPLLWAVATCVAGLVASYTVADHSRVDSYKLAQERFLQQSESLERVVQVEVDGIIRALNGIRGTYAASNSLDRSEFVEMAQAMEVGQNYSSVKGFGFVERVPRAAAKSFEAQQRRDGSPDFALKEVDEAGSLRGTAVGAGKDLMVVKYIEPAEPNRLALGVDLGSEPVRRVAAEIAMNTGNAAMSRHLQMVSDPQRRTGFLMFVPVYSKGQMPNSQDERMSTHKGWAMATVVWAELMVKINGMKGSDTEFQIFDAPSTGESDLLFDSLLPSGDISRPESANRERGRLFSVVHPVLLADQVLYFKTVSTPQFESAFDGRAHLRLAAMGSATSVLIALVVWLLLAGRSRALALAQRMTADLDRLAMVAKRTSNSVVMTDLQRRITWVNDGFTRLSGYTLDEVLGKVPGSFLQSEQTDPATRRAVGEELSALKPSHHVIRNRSKSGRDYWLEFEILPLFNSQGQATGFMGVQSDVTGQIEARDALAREKERAENILIGTNVGTWESNLMTGESRWSDRWHSMMGYTRDEVVPNADKFWQTVLHPDDAVRLNNAFNACVSGTQDSYSCEVRVRHKDGHWMWILSRARVMSRSADGRAEWLGGVHTDISEAKQTELDLRDTKSFLDRAGRMAGVGAWQVNLVTDEIVFSEQTCQIHGVPVGYRPTMEQALSFYSPQARELVQAHVNRALETGAGWDLVCEFVNARGEMLWVHAVGEVEYGDHGPVRLVGALQDVTRDRKAQLEIERSSALLRGAIDAIDEAFVLYGPDDCLVYCNEKYRLLYATSSDLMVEGAAFEDIVRGGVYRGQYPDAVGREEAWIAERLASHRTANATSEQKLASGRWLKVVEQRMPDGHTVGFRVDITSLKNATELAQSTLDALAREQGQLKAILEGTNVGTWEWNVQSGAVRFNERWASIAGYTLAELEPVDINTWMCLSHPEDLAASNEKLMLHFEGKSEFYECEARMLHKSGHWVWVLDRGKVASRNADGKPLVMSGTHMDITERKVAEKAVAALSATLQNVLDAAVNVAIISSGIERSIEVFNKGAENLLGYTAEEIVNKDTGIGFFDPTELSALSETMELAIGREPTVQELFGHMYEVKGPQEWTLVRKNGERFKATLIFSPMRDLEGGLTGNLCLAYDISKQKEFESSLREAMHMAEQSSVAKSQFLANMSHEIRTPMNAILGMLQLLQTTQLDQRQGDYVDKAKGAARSLLGLLNDILDFSKVEAGKMLLAPEPFDLEAMLEDLSVILSSNLGGKEVDLVYDIDPQVPRMLVGDALRIKQVLINLGGNAVKFTERGQVVLRVSLLARTPERVRLHIAVSDSGIGIAPENQARIFEAFTQAEANTTRRFGGTGLGLVISTRLIRLMGSELELQSAAGQGSTFSFSLDLPVVDLVTADEAPVAQSEALAALLVDDNPVAAAAQATLMRGLGWQVEVMGSGAQALAYLQRSMVTPEFAPDVVFLDSRMPQFDGWQTLREARRLFADVKAPLFIMMTGDNRDELAVRNDPAQAVFDGILVRPLSAGMISGAVNVARHSSQRASLSGGPVADLHPLGGMRVLLVEDNLINQQVAFELLSAQGALVSLAENGLIGVNAIKAADPRFDAVLMDLQMPVMDGLTATRLLREDVRFAQLPVIAMTANAMANDRRDCLEAGMNDHVGKPFDLKNLVETLVRHTRWVPVPTAAPVLADSVDPMPALAALPSAWPIGLDIDTALSRMGGNRALLKRAMVSFMADASQLQHRVEAYWNAGQWEDAKRELHAFKGLSATLGAMELSESARELEKQAADPQSFPHSRTLLAQLVEKLHTTLPAFEAVASALTPAPVPAELMHQTVQGTYLLASLRKLHLVLQDSDMESMLLHAQLRQGLDTSLDAAFEPLDAAMADMELEEAAVECEKLISRLAPH